VLAPIDLPRRMQQIILDAASQDARICLMHIQHEIKNAEITENSCPVLLIEGEGQLAPHALYLFALQAHAGKEFVYADEDELNMLGRHSPLFKPDYSPELAKQFNYFGSFGLISSQNLTAIQAVHRFIEQEADLAQTFSSLSFLRSSQVAHIPFVLLHSKRRRVYVPTKPLTKFEYPVFTLVELPTVSIIIPTKNHLDFLQPCLESISEKTKYPTERYEIIVIDNGSTDEDALGYMHNMAESKKIKLLKDPSKFNFSRLNNQAVNASNSDILVFLNNDTVVEDPLWLMLLIEQATKSDVGIVGAKLLYPDRTVQHGGMVLGVDGLAVHSHLHLKEDDASYLGLNVFTREISAITGACFAIRRRLFLESDCFDENLQIAFNDVLLCLSVLSKGYRNIYVHTPLFIHFESKTRGLDDTPEKVAKFWAEAIYAKGKYPKYFKNDPFYNPNLSVNAIYDFAYPPRVIKPWLIFKQNDPASKNILFLNAVGHEQDETNAVVTYQAKHFANLGYKVFIDGCRFDADGPNKVKASTIAPAEMAKFAMQNSIHCMVVHGSPFYSCSRWLGEMVPMIAFDYGEPDSTLFADAQTKQQQTTEKNFAICVVDRIYTFSEHVKTASIHTNTELMPLGEEHLHVLSNAVNALLNKQSQLLQ
jgi:GT2 family glycosyltransferase